MESKLNIEEQIIRVLSRQQKDFMTMAQLLDAFPVKWLNDLNIKKKAGVSLFVKKISPHIGNKVIWYRGGRYNYIGYQMPLKEIVFNRVLQKPGLSTGQLAMRLPMIKKQFIRCLNELLDENRIRCRFNVRYTAVFHVAVITSGGDDGADAELVSAGDREAFEDACQTIGKGGSFIRIHRVRERLNWSRKRFDRILTELRNDHAIQLHGGDPAELSEQQLQDSFVDEKGRLRITLTWRHSDGTG